MALLACLCAYAGLGPALADEGRTVSVAVLDASGNLVPNVSLSYFTEAGEVVKALRGEGGTYYVKDVGDVLAMELGSTVVKLPLPADPHVWVAVYTHGQTARAMIVSEKDWPNVGPMPQAGSLSGSAGGADVRPRAESSPWSATIAPRPGDTTAERSSAVPSVPPRTPGSRQGGEDCASATVIASLPFSDTGTTVGYADDYDVACNWTATAPDVVYSFAPADDIFVDITLCNGSDYDTKLFLYEDVCSGDGFACNDDACPGYVSELIGLELFGGHTYYIVIDGYGSSSGNYVLDMTEGDAPPDPAECPVNTLFGQPSVSYDSDPWAAVTSDELPGYLVYDNFWGLEGPICDFHWWGQTGVYAGGWFECDRDPDTYNIKFYPDNGMGEPDTGSPVCEYLDITPTKVDTGLVIDGWVVWKYDFDLDTCCAIADGWVSVEGKDAGTDCWFMWLNSETGDGVSFQWDGAALQPKTYNMSMCLTGVALPTGACCPGDGSCIEDVNEPACIAMGGEYQGDDTVCDPNPCPRVFGACCDDWTSTCIDCVELPDCPDPQRWFAETLCAGIDPLCGEITGACCDPVTRECTVETPGACVAAGGVYMGHDTTCAEVECPCFVFCTGTEEVEPDCGLPVDTTNGGCNYPDLGPDPSNCCIDHYPELGCDDPTCEAIVCAYDYFCCTYGWDSWCVDEAMDLCGDLCVPDYAFGAVACGGTFCGTGAFDGATRDMDWLVIDGVSGETQITLTVEAEFPVVAWLLDGTPGCGGPVVLANMVANECEEIVLSACVPGTGEYWVIVAADFIDPFTCDEYAEYSLEVTCGPCPTGACCPGDGSCVELTAPACAALPGDYEGDGTTCSPNPCPQPPENDECVNAIDVGTLPATETFNNTLGTDDIAEPCGVYSGPWKNVWYTVQGTGNTITATTCNAGTAVSDTKISVFCADCAAPICVDGNDDDCDDYGSYLSTISWCSEAGETYYVTVGNFSSTTAPGDIQVDFSDGSVCYDPPDCEPPLGACCVDGVCTATTLAVDCAGIWFEGETCPAFACPIPGGETCATAIAVEIPADLGFTDNNTTCFKIDDYEDTCLGSYDGGEDIIYELTVTADTCVNIRVNEVVSYSYLGVAIDDVCPLGASCIDYATSGNPDEILLLNLTVGTYYLMIDTWPSPECADFNLQITQCPTGGACCATDMSCTDVGSEGECVGLYMGDGTECATTDCPPLCPIDTINNPNVGQPPMMPTDSWVFGTSEIDVNGSTYIRYERFSGLTDDICDIHWWGAQLYLDPYMGWLECTDSDPTFEVKFYADGAVPGAEVCSYTVTPTMTNTGLNYGGLADAWYYEVDSLAPCCALTDGYVSIQGFGDTDCWFLWLGSLIGDGWSCLDDGTGVACDVLDDSDFDLSLCLTPAGEEQFGACCDDETGICTDDVSNLACLAPLRFAAGTLCAVLDPPCGGITGACCFADGTCVEITDDDCITAGGAYEGDGTDCDPNPCPQPCVPDFVVTAPGMWTGTTVGAGDDCPDLQAGEDHIYEVTIPNDGLWIFETCNSPSTFDSRLYLGTTCCGQEIDWDDDGCAKSLRSLIEADITAGTYYLAVEGYNGDTDAYELNIYEYAPPTGACCVDEVCTATTEEADCTGLWFEGETCPEFECPTTAGSDCTDTILVNIPADLDYNAGNTTCGKTDDYADTCMGSWDGGEDIFYELNVTAETCVEITVSEITSYSYFGMVLEGDCPPVTCDLMSDWGDPDVISATLSVGTYYLMIDHYPTPYCEAFTISMTTCAAPSTLGDWDDPDGDEYPNVCDNCPDDYNPGQEDVGEVNAGDTADWVGDICDNCPEDYNPLQVDTDSDGKGDVCDPCPLDNPDDPDDDGYCSSDEECPYDPLKSLALQCGCGVGPMDGFNIETDSDDDGVSDCIDCAPGVDDAVYCPGCVYPECGEAIPTTSQWGLIVLALLLLAGAKVYFGRRTATA